MRNLVQSQKMECISWSVLPGSSSIDWCEENYVHSRHIAEYYNVISNILFLLMPPLLIYLFHPYTKCVGGGINAVWLLLMVVGLGSIYFHSTLSFAGQLVDELAIAWVLLCGFTIWTPAHLLRVWPINGSRTRLGYVTSLIGVMAIVLALVKPVLNAFVLISTSIPASVMMLKELRGCKDRRAWKLCKVTLVWLITAVVLWVSDRLNCTFWLSIDFPYLHSLWHVCIFIAAYMGCVLCAYIYAHKEVPKSQPVIRYWPLDSFEHGVPYVEVIPSREKCHGP